MVVHVALDDFDFGSMPGTLTNLERDPLDTQRWNACGP
jgi:hypothetical protein